MVAVEEVPVEGSASALVQSLIATVAISIVPVFILPLIPAEGGGLSGPREQRLLRVLLAFAVGGLLGDVFLHLLPHAVGGHSHDDHASAEHDHADHTHDHSHDHAHEEVASAFSFSSMLPPGMWVILGVLAFFAVEKYVRFRAASRAGRSHSHSHGSSSSSAAASSSSGAEKAESPLESAQVVAVGGEEGRELGLRVSGMLNLVADAAHNFTDGLAIAASFQSGGGVGLSTTLAVLLHEIPHEVGDFAVLLQAGFSKRRAILAQLVTAIGAVLGCLLGNLLAESVASASAVILPFTAGGFIYISTVTILPELLDGGTPSQAVFEGLAILAGSMLMQLVGLLEAH